MKEKTKLTFGEEIINPSFNPENNISVDEIKGIFVKLIDMIDVECAEDTFVGGLLKENAIMQLLNAQMSCVKAITNKN